MSSSESGDPFDPVDVFSGKAEDVYGLWGDRSKWLLSDSDSDSDGSWRDIDDDSMDDIDAIRLPRERATHEYDGDMLQNMAGSADNEQRNRSALPPDIEVARWINEFGMMPEDFLSWTELVKPYMRVSVACK